MQFATPTALWWALLAVPIIVLYILKVRLRRVSVSTGMFWNQVFEEKRPRSIWQQLKHLLSLLVQLLFLALLVGAVADPFFESELQNARRLVLVIDNSASMNATDVAPSRLAAVKEQALALVRGLRWRDEMAVVAAGASPRVACGLSSHQKTLAAAIEAIGPSDAPTSVPEAVAMARRLISGRENAEIVVLSDGCFPEAADLAKQDDVRLATTGTPAANVGITLLAVRRSIVDVIGYQILVEVSNSSDEPVERQLELALGEQLIDVLPLKLAAGEVFRRVLDHTTAEGGELVATLGEDDALTADNRAVAILPRRQTRHVVLVTPGNLFLQSVFTSIPLVELSVTNAIPENLPPGAILVLHKQAAETLPAGNVLVIDPQSTSEHWTLGDPLGDPLVASETEDSPLMRHVDLQNIVLPGARKMEIAAAHEQLAGSLTDEPLYATIARDAGKLAVLSVDLDQADLPLRTAFPIMMTNALAWYSGQEGELREAIATGSVMEVNVAEQSGQTHGVEMQADAAAEVNVPSPDSDTAEYASRLVVVGPRGKEQSLPQGADTTTIGPMDECGIWRLERVTPPAGDVATADEQRPQRTILDQYAVNLASQSESNIRVPDASPREELIIAGFGGRPIWFYLAAAGLVLTSLEWYLYQRRWIA
jgi:hypothetical protein